MPEPTRPFQAPLIGGTFGCKFARSVTARNAPQVHCRSRQALHRSRQVYEGLKSVGLDTFGVEDDPAVTSHSTYRSKVGSDLTYCFFLLGRVGSDTNQYRK